MRPITLPSKEADWVARDFQFHSGEVMPELQIHYTTIGSPKGEPVLILHGTAQSGTAMLSAPFAGELFGPGQPLDANRYFLILPDAIGTGKSSKPSDGLRARFPKYNYDDMVLAQYRLVTEGLGIRHLRLVLGNSMGGMHTWVWGERYPDFMDALVPMASQPVELGVMERELARVKNGRLFLIPASQDTRGHGTTGIAKFWKQQLRQFLQSTPSSAN
jgi:homoserine O-acetyltransferase/O-succinyltransferase